MLNVCSQSTMTSFIKLCSFIKETVDEMEELNDPARAALKALQNVRSSIEIKASKDTRFGAILAQMPEFSK